MDFFDELKWRGLIKDVTDEESLRERLKSPITCYCGFDPTADSTTGNIIEKISKSRSSSHCSCRRCYWNDWRS